MADNEHSAEDRTEAPTEKRHLKARESGQLPVSRDLTMLASLGGATLGIVVLAPNMIHRMAERSANLLNALDRVRIEDGTVVGGQVSGVLLSAVIIIGAVALPAAVCGVGCGLLQTQFYVGGTPIRFQASRISPRAGFARIASSHNLLDFLKSCGRLVVLSLLVWSALRQSLGEEIASLGWDVAAILPVATEQIRHFARPLLVVLACFAAIDVLLVRIKHNRSMRMTREQVRLEMREAEGDPLIKAKIRRIREQRSRRRMMAKVKTADVVITNPTHYAVALSYDRTSAPRVVAKGADFVAARIREEARAHKVPIVPNPPLARALYQIELDHEIPGEHYRAVAQVIAFVWKLKSRAPISGFR